MAERLRSRVADIDVLQAEPIAIVGIGCRFPGGATSPDRYWQLLVAGRDAIVGVPADRWRTDGADEHGDEARRRAATRWGGFLERVDAFDAAFFGISPREAARMDPQQRLLLEVAWEALEDAGISREHLAGSDTGVFVASTAIDYGQMQLADERTVSTHTATGSAHCILANRLSYLLDLHGPSLSVDTACSSSLVAVHLACQGLRAGETDLALAGGVNVILSPAVGASLADWGMLAPDGRCKTFDARADGFVRGEGCGVVVLKRLSDAIAAGDRILAVIRGSAVNQDGRSTALTAPNGLAQQAVMRQALARAGLDPRPRRLRRDARHRHRARRPDRGRGPGGGLRAPREDGQPLLLGSVKTNIGHLEAAAGVAGLIKAVLALRHGVIPKNLHFERLNPHISIDGTRLAVPEEPRPWTAGGSPRVAGVSSFGFGGTNAHVLIEEAPRLPAPARLPEDTCLLPVSAHTAEALRERARDLCRFLEEDAAPDTLADIVFTAATRRTHHDHRAAVVGRSVDDVTTRLRSLLAGQPGRGCATGVRRPGPVPRVAFVFTGQGAQWWGMGRDLIQQPGVFRSAIEACDRFFVPLAGWSILDELLADESAARLDQTDVAQPALLAIQAGLLALWKQWGVTPAAVIGHSVGEIGAAYAAGALDLSEAVLVAYHRGRLMRTAAGRGRMAAVALGAAEAERAVEQIGLADRVAIAAVNGPSSVVISGETDAVMAMASGLERRGVRVRLLAGSHAFHSPQMDPFVAPLVDALHGLRASAPAIPVVSTVTGRLADAGSFDPHYWGRNIRSQVRFADGVDALVRDGCTTFVEIGAHPVLSDDLQQIAAARDASVVAVHSLRRGQPGRATMLAGLGALFVAGQRVDWPNVHPGRGQVVALPSYPWQRQSYWFDSSPARTSRPPSSVVGSDRVHPLLGHRVRSPALQADVFESTWNERQPAFFDDHRLADQCVAPATGLVEAAAAAAEEMLGAGPCRLEGFAIREAMVLGAGLGRVVQVIAHAHSQGVAEIEVVSRAETGDAPAWTSHASVRLRAETSPPPDGALGAARDTCDVPIVVDGYYQRLWDLGIRFGPSFRGVRSLWRSTGSPGATVGRIVVPEGLRTDVHQYRLHPALLDACFQTMAAPLFLDGAGDVFLPIGFDRLTIYRRPSDDFWCVGCLTDPVGREVRRGDLRLVDDTGGVLAVIEGLQLKRASSLDLRRAPRRDSGDLLSLEWRPQPLGEDQAPTTADGGRWLVLADRRGMAADVARHLVAEDGSCVLAFTGRAGARIDVPHALAAVAAAAWEIDPAEPEHVRRVLLDSDAGRPWRGVVVCWGLDDSLAPVEASSHPALVGTCAGLLHLVHALADLPVSPPLWIVTRGGQPVDPVSTYGGSPVQAPVWGMAATVALEHPSLPLACVDLDPFDDGNGPRVVVDELRRGVLESRVAYRDGVRMVPRLIPRSVRPASLEGAIELVDPGTGVLEELAWRRVDRQAPGPGEVEIRVRAAGLNFRDVLIALGLYPGASVALGSECAGVVTATGPGVEDLGVGDEVLAIASGAFRSFVVAPAGLVVRKPAGMTFEAAAGLPSAFLTAVHALVDCARVQTGDRVLIHAAAGGVGLAAVQVAHRAGADVYATAGSDRKRAFLRAQGVHQVMDSRSISFAREALAATAGHGVEIVLNSLTGEFIPASLSALAPHGRFVEIGKRGSWSAAEIAAVRPGATYHPFDLGALDVVRLRSMLLDVVRAMEAGELQALPTQAFAFSRAADAFRHMAQARHVGKIVLVPDEAIALPVRSDATYLITGGAGALGLLTASWLIARGGRHVVLANRTGEGGPETRDTVSRLGRQGAQVHVARADVTSRASLEALIAGLPPSWPPLRGIVHAAGVLDDGTLGTRTWARMASVLVPKVDGAWHLHELTRSLPLDFFVLFSSASSLLGSTGQASYTAANAFLDALAHWRRAHGLPALSVNWGPWAGAGMAARMGSADRQRLMRQGLEFMEPARAFEALETLLCDGDTQALVAAADWTTYLRERPAGPWSSLCDSLGARAQVHERSAALAHTWTETLRLTPADRVRPVVLEHLRQQAVRVLGLDPRRTIDPRQPLQDLGLDSLMAVELRNALGASLGRQLPATLLFDHPTLDALADRVSRDLGLGPGAVAPRAAAQPGSVDGVAIAAMSDDEAEASLLAELAELDRETRDGDS